MITGEVSGLVLSGCLRKKSQSCHTKLYPVSRSSVAPGGNQYVGHRGPTLHKKLLSIIMPPFASSSIITSFSFSWPPGVWPRESPVPLARHHPDRPPRLPCCSGYRRNIHPELPGCARLRDSRRKDFPSYCRPEDCCGGCRPCDERSEPVCWYDQIPCRTARIPGRESRVIFPCSLLPPAFHILFHFPHNFTD